MDQLRKDNLSNSFVEVSNSLAKQWKTWPKFWENLSNKQTTLMKTSGKLAILENLSKLDRSVEKQGKFTKTSECLGEKK